MFQAQDGDEMNTINSQIEYFLDSDSDSWILSNITVNSTGEIYFQYPIDFETLPNQTSGVFTFNVSATDFGEPARVGNATVEVTVEVREVDLSFNNRNIHTIILVIYFFLDIPWIFLEQKIIQHIYF